MTRTSSPSHVTLDSVDLLLDGAKSTMTEEVTHVLPPDSEDPATIPVVVTERSTLPSADSSVGHREADWSFVAIGSLIDGKYRVERELGRGAMGIVALAHDETLARHVALKLIRSDHAAPGFRDRFRQEARAMARVNHVNVVHIYASGEHGTVPYFVMELVNGNTLEEWLEQKGGVVELATAVRILTEVCDGLSAIHAADTLHRDIKPSNILLGADLHPRIADLGVSTAYRADGLPRAEIVGTPAYMAPEVAFPTQGQPMTPRADVYSLACVAYEMLTGQPLFDAKNEQQWLLQHATAPIRPPSSLRSGLPTAFDAVLFRALAKDPSERTPTPEAFRRDLLLANGDVVEPVRILVTEDDDDFRGLLGEHLGREFPEAEVICVSNGLAALEVVTERPPSVVILDLNMPSMDGFEVTRRLRALESARAMPIIVLSGTGGPAEWRTLSSIGADRFLLKPVSLDDLVTSVRHSLRERSRASEIPTRIA